MYRTVADLVSAARRGPAALLAVPAPRSDDTFSAVVEAARAGMVEPILLGDRQVIREALARHGFDCARVGIVDAATDDEAARLASALVARGEAHVLMKGDLKTGDLMRAALHAEHGLRAGGVMSDVMVSELPCDGGSRLVGVTDGGMNVAPDLEGKAAILSNAVSLFHGLGFDAPRVAVLCATELETPGMPHSLDAARLVERACDGRFGRCHVAGPMALDGALSPHAALAKHLDGPVGGHADILVVPSIEAGNMLAKAFRYLAGKPMSHVIEGALAPILIPSRTESAEDKLGSIALGVLRTRGCALESTS